MTVGVLAIGRPTFDLESARQLADDCHSVLQSEVSHVVGSPRVSTTREEVRCASEAWRDESLDALVVVQATFTDSTLVAEAAETTDAPIVLWGAPEPRSGGRLLRNSLCGINLAAYRLALTDRRYRYLFRDPQDPVAAGDLSSAMEGVADSHASYAPAGDADGRRATEIVSRLRSTRVGVVGRHPDGFEPCGYDADEALSKLGVTVDAVELDELFDIAGAIPDGEVSDVVAGISRRLDTSRFTTAELSPSAALHIALDRLCTTRAWDGVATRCWPECFTEMGGAACTAQALLNSEEGVPAQCEADVYGAITGLLLQWASGTPSFTADLVDIDRATNTGVFWHCGVAPFEMAATDEPRCGVAHPNRGLPLLNEFALRSGTITIARLSRSRGRMRLVVGEAEMLDRPRPFSGTSGTVAFDRPVDAILDTVMSEGLDHHYGITYGQYSSLLRAVAASLGLDTIEL